MKNSEKNELVRIIKNIPSDIFYTWKITKLWKKYGYGYTYATFRNYLKVFRQVRRNEKSQQERDNGERILMDTNTLLE